MTDSSTHHQKAMLMEMGFEEARVQEALTVCNGNAERAVEYLFSGVGGNGGASDPPAAAASSFSASSGPTQDIAASISQYSLDQGRSACTCIAMTAAQRFLRQPDTQLLTPQCLQDIIQSGVENYQNLQQQQQQTNNNGAAQQQQGVEHMSAEEVLGLGQETFFPNLQLAPGGIRQGILSKSTKEMGIQAMLTACHQDAPTEQWMAVLITKTPETILVCLPPKQHDKTPYIVIDSHPRPGVVDSNGGAYARIVTSMNDMVAHLETILPATELGPDIPEMVAMMYNSFDLYPFVVKNKA